MRKKLIILITILLCVSCSSELNLPEKCMSRTCVYDLLINISFDGLGIGSSDPQVENFLETYSDPISIGNIKNDIKKSLGLTWVQMRVFVQRIATYPELATSLVRDNREILSNLLEFSDWRDRSVFWSESAQYWIDNIDSDLSQDFELFYQKYGHLSLFPWRFDNSLISKNFHNDMNMIVEKYPQSFINSHALLDLYAPEKYKSWLFVRRWKERIGIDNMKIILNEFQEIL